MPGSRLASEQSGRRYARPGPLSGPELAVREMLDGVFERVDPLGDPVPLVLDSPHSGTTYPVDFPFVCDRRQLREAEDSFVDELFKNAPSHGATLLRALFPRSYIDPNRAADDIDPLVIEGRWPGTAVPTEKSRLGMGLIRRLSKPGIPMYERRLAVDEVVRRIERCYRPYHAALEQALEQRYREFGVVFLLDCHSMPSIANALHLDDGQRRTDIVLGDRDGTTCSRELVVLVEETLRDLGYAVRRNYPYKGVEIIRRHGHPERGRHALQLEINRALYMDERTLTPTPGFADVQRHLDWLLTVVVRFVRARSNAG